MQKLKKIDMAVEQLEDALEAYFKGRYHSATVLAGAAEQLFAGYLRKYGLKPTWVQDRTIITKIANGLTTDPSANPITEDDIGDLMNRAYNNSKHAGKTDHEIELDAREESQGYIDRAISDFDQLSMRVEHDLPEIPLAQRFREESISKVRME